MSIETAKKAVDIILSGEMWEKNNIPLAVELDFIGGEPLLEIDLIRDIYEYFLKKCIELNHPWLLRHRISICSNGVLYFDPKVQDFLKRYGQNVSFSVSLDGTKELHDACRVFKDGTGSYDIAIKAARHYRANFGEPGSKITISPQNVQYVFDAIINMRKEGYDTVFANCIFEKGWTDDNARELYRQMIKLSDYCYDNDTYETFSTSLFEESFFCPIDYTVENKNWCGGTGNMLAVDYRGIFYPCLRYMPSSLGEKVKPIVIGNLEHGIFKTEEEKKIKNTLESITATSQSSQKCISCPIRSGCAWCSAYNYQETGSVNCRVTYICSMHKARALANAYYWNKFYEKHNIPSYYINYVPAEWGIALLGNEEWKRLVLIEKAQKERSEKNGM